MNNENDNAEVKRRVIAPLKRIVKSTDAPLLMSHHIGKPKQESGQAADAVHRGRGASALAELPKLVLNLDSRDGKLILSCAKQKVGEPFPDAAFTLNKETRWLSSTEAPAPAEPAYMQIVNMFKPGETLTRFEVGTLTADMNKRTVTRYLKEAVDVGALTKTEYGQYCLADDQKDRRTTPIGNVPLSFSVNGNECNDLGEDGAEAENVPLSVEKPVASCGGCMRTTAPIGTICPNCDEPITDPLGEINI